MTSARESLLRALAARKAASTALADHDARIASFAASVILADAAAEAAHDGRLDAEAARLLGEEVGDPPDDETEREAARRGEVARRASERLRAERPMLASRLARAEAAFTTPALQFVIAERDMALAAALEAITALAAPLAGLLAADHVRERIVGPKFTFDSRVIDPATLWSGGHAVRAFLAAIPARLRPAELDPGVIEAEAVRRANTTTTELEDVG